jgi:hypothetical protein
VGRNRVCCCCGAWCPVLRAPGPCLIPKLADYLLWDQAAALSLLFSSPQWRLDRPAHRFLLRGVSLHSNAHGRQISRPSRSLGQPRRFKVAHSPPNIATSLESHRSYPRLNGGNAWSRAKSGGCPDERNRVAARNGGGATRGVERPFLRESIHRLRLLCRVVPIGTMGQKRQWYQNSWVAPDRRWEVSDLVALLEADERGLERAV